MKIRQLGRFTALFIGTLVVLMSLASCQASVSVSTSEGKIEPEAEARYRNIWKSGSAAVASANRGFESGVCNVGGNQRGCYEASAKAVQAIDQFLGDLDSIAVPSRYRKGDTEFRAALELLRDGFERRNQGFARHNHADFLAGNDMLKRAETALGTAYKRFPVDARP